MHRKSCFGFLLLAALPAFAVAGVAQGAAPQVRDYVLGDARLPDRSPFGPLPVRLQGAIALPAGGGRHPLVVVVHGRHTTGCPLRDHEIERWPCRGREQRNDLGFRHVLAALARRGMVAISPNVNGAHTEGWGEPDDVRRWPRIVNRHLAALAADVRGGGRRFGGLRLRGRVRLARIGFLGHSLSGRNSARAALRRARVTDPARIAAGRGPLSALLLLAPVRGTPLADVPTAVVLGSCDMDTGTEGRAYLDGASRQRGRRSPVVELTVRGANHAFWNGTLARRGQDEAAGSGGRCRRSARLPARRQLRWIDRAAADFFAATLLRAPDRPAWLRRSGPLPGVVHGEPVRSRRLVP